MKRFEHTSSPLPEGPRSCSAGHNAVEHEDLPKLRDLPDNGYDVENDNDDGWTLLRHAIDNRQAASSTVAGLEDEAGGGLYA